jgi:hypothetical protein
MATIDHLYSKYNPLRQESTNDTRRVLSCYKCNHERGMIEDRILAYYLEWPKYKKNKQSLVLFE